MAAIDPIANMLTKLRNACRARHPTVDLPASRMARSLMDILKQEGFIRNHKPMGEGATAKVRVYLKYMPDRAPAISDVVRVSKAGRRQYCKAGEVPRVLGGLGRAILSTSKGLKTDQEAYRQRIGGEVMCYIW